MLENKGDKNMNQCDICDAKSVKVKQLKHQGTVQNVCLACELFDGIGA